MARDEINAFLGVGTTYEGKLNFQGSVRIDGHFRGEVTSEGTLVVGSEAVVDGVVKVGQLILSGRIHGDIAAREKTVLHKTANMQGKLYTPVLVVEEGAIIDGSLNMTSAPDQSEVGEFLDAAEEPLS